MEIFWIMGAFFVFITFLYVVISLMFPEWVGITGKKALQIQKEQQQEEQHEHEHEQNQNQNGTKDQP